MRRVCEVCENFQPQAALESQRLVEVRFGPRAVTLCQGHARIAENSGARSFRALRELYGAGRRSYVPRRAAETGTPGRSAGRRATDARLPPKLSA